MCEICDARWAKLQEASDLMRSEKRGIEAQWYLFRMNEPPGATEEEIDWVREVFFAGAEALFDLIADCGTRKAFEKLILQVEHELDTQELRNQTAMGTA